MIYVSCFIIFTIDPKLGYFLHFLNIINATVTTTTITTFTRAAFFKITIMIKTNFII